MPEMVQKARIVDAAAKPAENKVEWLRLHNNQVASIIRESAAFKTYQEKKKVIANILRRHPDRARLCQEKEERNIQSFRKRMLELNRKCTSAKEDCEKATAGQKG